MDDRLLTLGLARRAGKLAPGEDPVDAACRAHQAWVVLLAMDAAENTRRRAAHFAQAGGAPLLALPYTKAELGGLLGRGSCAMLAVTDGGLAALAVEKLAETDPEIYGAAAAALRTRADAALTRQRAHVPKKSKYRHGGKHPAHTPQQSSNNGGNAF